MSNLRYIAPVLRVADLRRSLSYYRERLGFDVEFNYGGFYACVARDGCRIHLKESNPPERDASAFETAEHLDVCLGVADAQALATQFAAAGVGFSVPLRSMDYGEEFYVRDPDGYILGFVQARSPEKT
jgi:catechol 2,3-dioxygenase-like lactoylglutathione lyase family enzyme